MRSYNPFFPTVGTTGYGGTSTGTTIPAKTTVTYTSDKRTVALPSQIVSVGFEADLFFGPDPDGINASLGSLADRYVAFTNSCADIGGPPVIQSFTANPNIVKTGEKTTLSWSVTGADPTKGQITLPTDIGHNPLLSSKSGSFSFIPSPGAKYTLTASNSFGTASQDVFLVVLPAPRIASQIAFGGNWETSVVVQNPGNSNELGMVSFFDESGNPLVFPSRESGSQSSFYFTLAPYSSMTLSSPSPNSSSTVVGWAQLEDFAAGNMQAFAVFRQTGSVAYEATVPFEDPFFKDPDKGLTIPFDNTNGFATGVALVNSAPSTADQSAVFNSWYIWLTDATGNLLVNGGYLFLSPGQHVSFSLTDRYPETRGSKGLIRISPIYYSTGGFGTFMGLGLRFNPSGPFTTLPSFRTP